MRNSNTVGVDLAKNVIQVSVVTPANKELSNKELSRIKFAEFLAKQKPGLVTRHCPPLDSFGNDVRSSGQDNPRHGGGSVQAGA